MSLEHAPGRDGAAPTRKLAPVQDAADYLGVSVSYLNKLRCVGGGPTFIRIGSAVRYDLADLDAWIDARKFRNTAEADTAA